MTKAYRERLEPMGLTYPQYLVLLVLWEEDGLTVSEIGALLMLDSGTLTPVLKRMESSGLVARRRSSTDEREVVITLTKDAENLRAAGLDAQCAVHCRLGMSEDEIRALRADIMALVTNIEQPAG